MIRFCSRSARRPMCSCASPWSAARRVRPTPRAVLEASPVAEAADS